MLDIEPTDKKIDEMGGPMVLFESIRRWLDIVERHTPAVPYSMSTSASSTPISIWPPT